MTPARGRRTRIVLGEVARARRVNRTRRELAEQTEIGDALIKGLVRAQLALALRLALLVGLGLGTLPLLFTVAPALGGVRVLGVSLPWVLLGVLPYPFLVAVGWIYVRMSERNEREFTELVEK
ncbi:hypothetical protein [Longispora fulva]|uniref:DUF485 domain-containing protein n=1 Tax=Longispora fulva TaxID=619741 RepID=A0A8J7GMJ3_9ACTN|nr:hypothetical protein [Longispora fulva]MBG6139747.1 hypothetical protein [Longispora fulva]